MKKPWVRLHVWLENEDGLLFGHGRMQLLQQIDSLGSLRKAAESLGMSYRAAWGKLKATEAVAGQSLVERLGSNRDGCSLSAFGRSMLESYQRWFALVEDTAVRSAQECFPWAVSGFKAKPGPE